MTPEEELHTLQLQLLEQMGKASIFLEDMKDNFGNADKCMEIFSEFEPELKKTKEIETRIKELKKQCGLT